jgi:CHAD domain-containing protein
MDRKTRIAAGTVAGAGAAVAAAKAALDRRDGHGGDDGPSRKYRLKRKETPVQGLRRIAEGRADHALEQLREHPDKHTAASVHEARKDLKKLRSVLRLVRDELGDDVYRRENVRHRDAGRLLSGARDAEVKLETLSGLIERFPERLSEERLAPLIAALEAERQRLAQLDDQGVLERAVAEIEAGEAAVADWPLNTNDWSLIEPGLEREYRRGRKRFVAVREEATDEAVHEWRKRVKDLWYQLRLVRNAWPEVLDEVADQAHDLSDLLGDHHDLAVLRDDALERRDLLADGELEKLLASVSERQDQLADEALVLGERLYAEKPKGFVERVRSYWQAWR